MSKITNSSSVISSIDGSTVGSISPNNKMYIEKDGAGSYKLRIVMAGSKTDKRRSLQTKTESEARLLCNIIKQNYTPEFIVSLTPEDFNQNILSVAKQQLKDLKDRQKINYYSITCSLDRELDCLIENARRLSKALSANDKIQYLDHKKSKIEIQRNLDKARQNLADFGKELTNLVLTDEQLLNYCKQLGFDTQYHQQYISMLPIYAEMEQSLAEMQNAVTTTPVMAMNSEAICKSDNVPSYTFADLAKMITDGRQGRKEPKIVENNIIRFITNIGLKKSDVFDPSKAADLKDKFIAWLKGKKFTRTTIKHYKTAIIAFFKTVQHLYDDHVSKEIGIVLNVLDNFYLEGEDGTPFTEFTHEQLLNIFSFEHQFFKKHPSDFWTCVIGLFMGSRTNLAHTLCYSDVIVTDGIACVQFKDDKVNDDPSKRIKKAKNKASARTVPIHPQLLGLGFYDYIMALKAHKDPDNDFIFTDFFNYAGQLKRNVNNRLFEFLKQINIKSETFETAKRTSERYTFHSFRKTAAQHMRDSGISIDFVNSLIGWDGESTQEKYYTKRTKICELQKANAKFNYDFLQPEFDKWAQYWKQQMSQMNLDK